MKVLIPMHTAKGLALFHAQVSFRKFSNDCFKDWYKGRETEKYWGGNFKYNYAVYFVSCPKQIFTIM